MKYGWFEIGLGAVRRPDLVLRYLKGKMPSEYDLHEVARYVGANAPVVVEAGAYDGTDTRRFAKEWPQGTVYAFEPLPRLAALVRENTHDLANVIFSEVALGTSRDTSVTLNTFDDLSEPHGSSSILVPDDHLRIAPQIHFGKEISVPAVTLDSWHDSVGSPAIDLLWLDLQGAELAVLEHGSRLLRHTSVIHIEVSRKPLYKNAPTFRDVREFLKDFGFQLATVRIPVRSGNAIFTSQ